MKKRTWQLVATLVLILCVNHLSNAQKYRKIQVTDSLYIQQISPSTYVHTSFIQIKDYGPFPSNGLIYVVDGAAIVFDTPVYPAEGDALIEWLTYDLKVEIQAVIVNHFHDDCVGSLTSFHEAKIPSVANAKTKELAMAEGNTVPQYTFQQDTVMMLKGKEVVCHFAGEAHSIDNIVTYIPEEGVLFGGCMIKSIGARKGYLGVANVKEWSRTVKKVKLKFENAETIVPGHGDHGGRDLLDYTIGLFAPPRPRE